MAHITHNNVLIPPLHCREPELRGRAGCLCAPCRACYDVLALLPPLQSLGTGAHRHTEPLDVVHWLSGSFTSHEQVHTAATASIQTEGLARAQNHQMVWAGETTQPQTPAPGRDTFPRAGCSKPHPACPRASLPALKCGADRSDHPIILHCMARKVPLQYAHGNWSLVSVSRGVKHKARWAPAKKPLPQLSTAAPWDCSQGMQTTGSQGAAREDPLQSTPLTGSSFKPTAAQVQQWYHNTLPRETVERDLSPPDHPPLPPSHQREGIKEPTSSHPYFSAPFTRAISSGEEEM